MSNNDIAAANAAIRAANAASTATKEAGIATQAAQTATDKARIVVDTAKGLNDNLTKIEERAQAAQTSASAAQEAAGTVGNVLAQAQDIRTKVQQFSQEATAAQQSATSSAQLASNSAGSAASSAQQALDAAGVAAEKVDLANDAADTATAQAVIATDASASASGFAEDASGFKDQAATSAGAAASSASAAASSATQSGAMFSSTSTTSLTIGTGAKSLTTQAGKAWVVGQDVTLATSETQAMFGKVVSYDIATGALSLSISSVLGSGTFSSWAIGLSPSTLGVGILAVSSGGTGTTTSTGSGSVVLNTSPTLVTPSLGTPSALTLTNATGLPVSTGLTGLGTGIAAFLATPSSANLANAVTDETGSGALVFASSPTLTTPVIAGGTATALTSFSLRNGGTGAFNVTLAHTGTLTADRVLTINVNNSVRTLDLQGSLTVLAASVLSGSNTGDQDLSGYQTTLVSGTSLKTINSQSLLGPGNITLLTSPGGTNTQVQFNDAGVFNGDGGLTYVKGTTTLTVTNHTVTGLLTARAGTGGGTPSVKLGANGASIYGDTSGQIGFNTAANTGLGAMLLSDTTLRLDRDMLLAWSSGTNQSGLVDLIARREAAGVMSLRNGASAQTLQVYNYYSDAANFENAKFGWTGNTLEIGSEKQGTGITRLVKFVGSEYSFTSDGAQQFAVQNGSASAVNYWSAQGAATGGMAKLQATGSDADVSGVLIPKGAGSIYVQGPSGGISLQVPSVTTAVNYPAIYGAISGASPTLEARGADTNVTLALLGKGTGGVNFFSNGGGTRAQQFAVSHIASSVNWLQAAGAAAAGLPALSAQGADTHVGLNLMPKGRGHVGVNLATGSMAKLHVAGDALGAVAIAVSAIDTATEIATTGTAHGFTTGEAVQVRYGATGTSSGGLVANQICFVNAASSTTLTLHDTLADALAGTSKINLTSFGTATLTLVSASRVSSLRVPSSNETALDISSYRTSTSAADWTTTAARISWRVDKAPMGYLEFNSPDLSAGSVRLGTDRANGVVSLATLGGEQARISNVNLAVNYLNLTGNTAGSGPTLGALGTDSDITLTYSTKGAGAHVFQTNNFGQTQFRIAHLASAVNYPQVAGGATGNGPTLSAQGTDTNVDLGFLSKGTGVFNFTTGGGKQLSVLHLSTAVNYATIIGAATGNMPTFGAAGSDTNVNLGLMTKGTGSLYVMNSAGAVTLRVGTVASAVNYPVLFGAAAAGIPSLGVEGADTNVGFNIATKGTGTITFLTNSNVSSLSQFAIAHTAASVNWTQATGAATGFAPSLTVLGADTNIDFNIVTKGTGKLLVNGLPVSIGASSLTISDAEPVAAVTGSDWFSGLDGIRYTRIDDGVGAAQWVELGPGGNGDDGFQAGITYTSDSSTTDGDPGTGKVRFNNATFGSVTMLYIDDSDTNSVSMTNWIDLFDDSTSGVRGQIAFSWSSGAAVFNVTGAVVVGSGYRKVPVAAVSGALPGGGTKLSAIFTRSGDGGTNGTNGTDGGVNFTFASSISDADPGNGLLRFNNAVVSGVTQIFVDNLDSAGTSIFNWLDGWDDSSHPSNKGTLTLRHPNGVTLFTVSGAVVDGSGYRKVPVTYVSGPIPTDTNKVTAVFARTGDTGTAGAAGLDAGMLYTFDNGVTDADPGGGLLRFNNATPASATFLYINTNNQLGTGVSTWLDALGASTNPSDKGVLLINHAGGTYAFLVTGAVTAGSGYRKVPVTAIGGAGPSNTNKLSLLFARTGNVGAQGPTGPFTPKGVSIPYPATTDAITLFYTPTAIALTQITAALRGSSTPSVTWTLKYNAARNAAGTEVVSGGVTTTSLTAAATTSFTNGTIAAGSWLWLEITAVSGTVQELTLSLS
jgi:hypothetical protein